MKIFTTDELRAIWRYSIDEEGLSPVELVSRVAQGVSEEIISRYLPTKPIAVFAGPDYNGAEAVATAANLLSQGYSPKVFLFNIGGDKINETCAYMRDRFKELPGADLTEVIHDFSLPDLNHSYLVVDGLFGTGSEDLVTGGFVSLVRYINESHASIISIDVPSGLSSDWNTSRIHRDIIHADITLAVQYPRIAFFLKENAALVGEWKTLDIGLSSKAAAAILPTYYLIEMEDVRRRLRKRNKFCSKADLGTAAIVAGCYGMMGAACLAARGALRAGVGKLTVFSPRCGFGIMQSSVPEALFQADKNDIIVSGISLKTDYNAISIGPGIGTHEMTVNALEDFLNRVKKPVILDADAINCISQRPSMLNSIPVLSIITPHAGEFDRLFGPQTSDEARLRKAAEMAKYYNIFIVLKGHHTIIARPDGKIYFNSSGSPALATAGSGDVLTGVITSFLAQGFLPEIAAMMGVFIHGLAGEITEHEQGTYGTISGDVANNIGKAIKSIMDSQK